MNCWSILQILAGFDTNFIINWFLLTIEILNFRFFLFLYLICLLSAQQRFLVQKVAPHPELDSSVTCWVWAMWACQQQPEPGIQQAVGLLRMHARKPGNISRAPAPNILRFGVNSPNILCGSTCPPDLPRIPKKYYIYPRNTYSCFLHCIWPTMTCQRQWRHSSAVWDDP